MLDFIRFKPRPLLGLDIQADSIRLLELQYSRKIPFIKRALTIDLPINAVMESNIEKVELVSDRLRELVECNKLQKIEVAIALPERCVVTKHISVAKGLRLSELEAEIISDLSDCFPSATEGLYYDYVMLDSKDKMQDEVLLIATSFTHLNTPVMLVQDCGLKVRVVDVDKYALIRAHQCMKKDNFQMEEKWLVSWGLALHSGYVW
ncbi:MAG: pilus assembly protein PilM [Gammaproteobacteria bacterium]|jgi:type IV pilus assembly protein PilM|nr:pilus assembly protein PilM [Gammaproteobacteria bacterium]